MTKRLWQDLIILVASILVAIAISQIEFLRLIFNNSLTASPLESFTAGLFFTSFFTTAPAIVVLGKLAQSGSLITVSVFGALGAVCGDYLIFRFVRDRLGDDLKTVMGGRRAKKFTHFIKSRAFRWLSPFVAGAIIASPLPDELAIMVMGFARARTSFFVPFSFVANFVGIILIGLVARAI